MCVRYAGTYNPATDHRWCEDIWSGAGWYRSGAATPTPTCTDLCVVCYSRYVPAVVSELPEAEGSEASRRVAAPQHDSYCIVIPAMSSICCMSYLPNNFSHTVISVPGLSGRDPLARLVLVPLREDLSD